MKFKLSQAKDSDLNFCMAVGHEGLRPYVEAVGVWDQEQNERDFLSDWNAECTWIIEQQGEKVGYLRMSNLVDGLTIDGIFVEKIWRGQGIGESVLKYILTKSIRPVSLKVYKNNPAFKLYQRLKFEVVRECELRYYMTWKPELGNN